MNSAIIIPARYGSTRFPGKVLAPIGDKPMIVRVAEKCKQTKADKVIVVTDNSTVYSVCLDNKIEVMLSPENISTGTDRVAFAADKVDCEIIINVQGDEPFIPSALIDELIDGLQADKDLQMITACVPFKTDVDSENPSAVKVVMDNSGNALYFSRYPIPFDRDKKFDVTRFRHIGIYGFKRNFLFQFAKMAQTTLEKTESLEQLRVLENGYRIKVIKTSYSPVSVDTPEDLEVARRYFEELNTGD